MADHGRGPHPFAGDALLPAQFVFLPGNARRTEEAGTGYHPRCGFPFPDLSLPPRDRLVHCLFPCDTVVLSWKKPEELHILGIHHAGSTCSDKPVLDRR